MGRRILKQPNGLYAVWSSIPDAFIMWNATGDEIIDLYVKEEMEAIERGKESVRRTLKVLDGEPISPEDLWDHIKIALSARNQSKDELRQMIKDMNTPIEGIE